MCGAADCNNFEDGRNPTTGVVSCKQHGGGCLGGDGSCLRSQSILKPNNNKTRLTTAKLFVGVELWLATLYPFYAKSPMNAKRKAKPTLFLLGHDGFAFFVQTRLS
jgi:hypothetical protein